ncbi:MAG: response regulator [Campylobacterota bacterium]|nr:response regulator [Campylobacterota bacterium]
MKKVVIVDDEHEILETLTKFLGRSEKYEIDTYSNPTLALESVKRGNYDLVLLDIMMPQMDGINFLKEVKEVVPKTKVIMMTAFSTEDRLVDCNKFGADDYVTKPFMSLRDVENKVFDNLGL